jgi:hypothetical protein
MYGRDDMGKFTEFLFNGVPYNELVNLYNLKNRDDNIAIWFTGKTLFINNNLFSNNELLINIYIYKIYS